MHTLKRIHRYPVPKSHEDTVESRCVCLFALCGRHGTFLSALYGRLPVLCTAHAVRMRMHIRGQYECSMQRTCAQRRDECRMQWMCAACRGCFNTKTVFAVQKGNCSPW